MAIVSRPVGSSIDFPPDDGPDSGREVDPSALALGAVFGSVALPEGMPDYLKAAILDRAKAARDAAGDFIIDNRMNPVDVRARQAKADADDDDNVSQFAQIVRQERAQERERLWDQSRVSIGAVAMSGQAWDDAFEFLSDPKRRGQLIDSVMQHKGWTKDRAEKAADDALTLAQIAQRKKDGTITATDEQNASEITRHNPDAAEMVKEAARQKLGRGLSAEADASAATRSVLSGDMTTMASEYQAVLKNAVPDMSRTAGDHEPFASAPNLIAHFDNAREACLAAPAIKPATPLPQSLVAKIDMNGPF